jgi:hypothetical protein
MLSTSSVLFPNRCCAASQDVSKIGQMHNRVFFPQQTLDTWLAQNRVEVTSRELTLKAEQRTYRVVDAVRVLREVTRGQDQYDIVGQVKSVNFLLELGAELLGTSMIIGESAYDVVPGFLGTPIGDFEQHRARRPDGEAGLQSDEELLARYLVQDLD